MALQGWMVHLSHFGMVGQEIHYLECIFDVTFDAQAKCLDSLQKNERIEGRNGSTRVTQQDGTNSGDVGSCTYGLCKDNAMIRRIRLGQSGELVGIGQPVELAAIDNDTAKAGTMTTQELCSRVDHDVGTMLQRTNQVGCTERIVHDKRNTMLMSHGSHAFEVEHIAIGIAKGLGIHHLRVRLNGSLQSSKIIYINDCIGNALRGKSMSDQIIRTTIQVVSSYNVVTCLHDVLQRVSDGGCTTGHCQTSNATLQGSYSVLKHALRRIGQTSVDVAGVPKSEAMGTARASVAGSACSCPT